MLFLYLFNLTKNKSYLLILTVFLAGISIPLIFRHFSGTAKAQAANASHVAPYDIVKLKDYSLIQPFAFGEMVQESNQMSDIKHDLSILVDSLKSSGCVTDLSLHLINLENSTWTGIEPDGRYHPASLMKVPLMLAILRKVQTSPKMLDEKMTYARPPGVNIQPQFYPTESIEDGKAYSLHELLYFMAANSDNEATYALASRFDEGEVMKIFKDLNLPQPVPDDLQFTLSAKEYSRIVYAIFNASFLSPEFSEYAAELLSNCAFKDGFSKGFPPGTKVWHKFGEWRHVGNEYELHESGVVYLADKPYLLTVFSKGKDTPKLASAIQAVANRVYRGVVKHS